MPDSNYGNRMNRPEKLSEHRSFIRLNGGAALQNLVNLFSINRGWMLNLSWLLSINIICELIKFVYFSRCSTAECEKRSLKEIDYLHLSHTHIRTLGYIQSCRHIRVCILSNNYLTRFNALANCPELVRLDLHSNQVSEFSILHVGL